MVNNARRYVGLLVILVAAASVSWWSGHKESRVSAHIHTEVVRLVPKFHNNPSFINSIVVDPILGPTLANSLDVVYVKSEEFNGEFDVVVTGGDDERFGDGTATHVAIFQINSEPVAGLRIICSSETEKLLVAGAWVQ